MKTKSNKKECNLQWNSHSGSRGRIRLFFTKVTKKHDTTKKKGVGEFLTKIKNKIYSLEHPITQTQRKFQPSFFFFLYTGNTIKVLLQELEGTTDSCLIP